MPSLNETFQSYHNPEEVYVLINCNCVRAWKSPMYTHRQIEESRELNKLSFAYIHVYICVYVEKKISINCRYVYGEKRMKTCRIGWRFWCIFRLIYKVAKSTRWFTFLCFYFGQIIWAFLKNFKVMNFHSSVFFALVKLSRNSQFSF